MGLNRVLPAALRPVLAALAGCLSLALEASAVTLPPGFVATRVTTAPRRATAMAVAPDGRLFICEQEGRLRVVKEGVLLDAPFLTVPVSRVGERGLLGVAFDPDFATTRHVFVYYTATSPAIHNRVSRFTAAGDRALRGSEQVILELPDLGAAIHNGGALHFGADGMLYVAVGENTLGANAQSLETPLGKILRLRPDGSVPEDNPFFATAGEAGRAIWAYGLRNPFTFAFDPDSSRMFINDVGMSRYEEINDGVPGGNYGWPATEGPTNNPAYRRPIHAYRHGVGCAITGGVFYAPATQQFPDEYRGSYFFADFCAGWIRRLLPHENNRVVEFATGLDSPLDLDLGPDGSLYYLTRHRGVFRVVASPSGTPQIAEQPLDQTVAVGQPASFHVAATGAGTLGYRWRRDGVDVAGAVGPTYTIAATALADHGARFDVVVANAVGTATSRAALLSVVDGQAPAAAILAPAPGTTYRAGDTIAFEGGGTDAEDGALPVSASTWRVDFHHAEHVHPFMPPAKGLRSGSFAIPVRGETATDVWFRIHLRVQDSSGLSHAASVDVRPRLSTLALVSSPPGLTLTLDGEQRTAPATASGVVGLLRAVGAPSPQTLGGERFVFDHWSDGRPAGHDVRMIWRPVTYTAVFRRAEAGAAAAVERERRGSRP